MAVIKFGNITDVAEAAEDQGSGFYSGPVPQEKGVYPCKLKKFELVTNRKGDPMIKAMAVIDAPKGHKFAKFNGYAIWFQQNVTDQGKPFVNQLLNALSDGTEENSRAIRSAFWSGGMTAENKLPSEPSKSAGSILKIGPLKFGTKLEEGKIEILIAGKPGKDQNDQPKLDAGRYIMPQPPAEDDEDDDDDDESDEYAGTEARELVEETGSEELDDEDDDDDDDDDDSDVPF